MYIFKTDIFRPDPATIDSVAFSPSHPDLLAVGYRSGAIKVLNTASCAVKCDIAGSRGEDIRRIVWHPSDANRLFTAGVGGDFVEWDLESGQAVARVHSPGGAIWDMALVEQTSLSSGCKGVVLAGCTHGGLVVLVDMERQAVLKTLKSGQKGVSLMSICVEEDYIFTGSQNGLIERWRIGKWTCDQTVDLIPGSKRKKRNDTVAPIVWTLRGIGKGRLASGDSTGRVCVWDVATGTLLQTIREHQGDVLCLHFCPQREVLVASGMDARVVMLGKGVDSASSLSLRGSRFLHRRDVNSVAISPVGSDLLASAGVDGQVVLTDLADSHFGEAFYLPPNLNMAPKMFLSSTKRVAMYTFNDRAELWHFPRGVPPSDAASSVTAVTNREPMLMCELTLEDSDGNICASTLSADARMVALATESNGLRIFAFDLDEVNVSLLARFPSIPVRSLVFARHTSKLRGGRLFIATADGRILQWNPAEPSTLPKQVMTTRCGQVTSLSVQHGHLLCADSSGALSVLRISGEGTGTLLQVPVAGKGESVWATSVALSDDLTVFASLSSGQLLAYDMQRGARKWQIDLRECVTTQAGLEVGDDKGRNICGGSSMQLGKTPAVHLKALSLHQVPQKVLQRSGKRKKATDGNVAVMLAGVADTFMVTIDLSDTATAAFAQKDAQKSAQFCRFEKRELQWVLGGAPLFSSDWADHLAAPPGPWQPKPFFVAVHTWKAMDMQLPPPFERKKFLS